MHARVHLCVWTSGSACQTRKWHRLVKCIQKRFVVDGGQVMNFRSFEDYRFFYYQTLPRTRVSTGVRTCVCLCVCVLAVYTAKDESVAVCNFCVSPTAATMLLSRTSQSQTVCRLFFFPPSFHKSSPVGVTGNSSQECTSDPDGSARFYRCFIAHLLA